jgi:hypothetical protein
MLFYLLPKKSPFGLSELGLIKILGDGSLKNEGPGGMYIAYSQGKIHIKND